MKTLLSLSIAAALPFVLANAAAPAGPQGSNQDETKAASPDTVVEEQDATERIAALEEALARQAAEVSRARAEIADLRRALGELQLLAEGLEAGAQSLEAAVSVARDHGFEMGGPNPMSRTDLLEGLQGFARQIRSASPPPTPEPGPIPANRLRTQTP